MSETQIDIQEVLGSLRETIGQQAQEIAILKATITAMSKDLEDKVE